MFLYCAPFWVALILPRFVLCEGLRGWQWLGLAGALLALGDGLLHPAAQTHPLPWLGDLLGLVAGLMWGLTTVVFRSTPVSRVSPEKLLL